MTIDCQRNDISNCFSSSAYPLDEMAAFDVPSGVGAVVPQAVQDELSPTRLVTKSACRSQRDFVILKSSTGFIRLVLRLKPPPSGGQIYPCRLLSGLLKVRMKASCFGCHCRMLVSGSEPHRLCYQVLGAGDDRCLTDAVRGTHHILHGFLGILAGVGLKNEPARIRTFSP